MERLLTDEECHAVQGIAAIPEPVLEAQDAKSIKAVAEWLNEYCQEPSHGNDLPVHRRYCFDCMRSLWQHLREGKLPGEEK